MKLLLDQNLSHRLLHALNRLYPGSTHVRLVGLEEASDAEIWDYAKTHDFVIVSQDADFQELAQLQGSPPKVIWLQSANTSTDAMRSLLVAERRKIEQFVQDPEPSCLVLAAADRPGTQ